MRGTKSKKIRKLAIQEVERPEYKYMMVSDPIGFFRKIYRKMKRLYNARKLKV